MSMMHCILVFVLAATTQPASRPAPDLSRMTAERLRSYATGLFNRVAYLEQQLATERRTSEALRKSVADGDAKIIELSQEVERLRKIEEAYGETPEGKKAAAIEAAIKKGEPIIGMSVEHLRRAFGNGTLISDSGSLKTYKYHGNGDARSMTGVYYLCDIKDGKLLRFDKIAYRIPDQRAVFRR